jgi:hypothetical protein
VVFNAPMQPDITRVLVVGYDPDSDPALPRGIDAENSREGSGRGQMSLLTQRALGRRQGPCCAEQKNFDG